MDTLDVILKGVGLAGAVAYFIYRVAAGSLAAATSLSLAAVASRERNKALVTVQLERGDLWSVLIERIELVSIVCGKRSNPLQVQFKHESRKSLRLSPKEKTLYGVIMEISTDFPTVIECLVVSQQQFFFRSPAYLIGSIVVEPIADSDTPSVPSA